MIESIYRLCLGKRQGLQYRLPGITNPQTELLQPTCQLPAARCRGQCGKQRPQKTTSLH